MNTDKLSDENENPILRIGAVSGSHLDKCLKAISKYKMGDMLVNTYDKRHVLRFDSSPMSEWIICTSKQAKRLIAFSKETELIPGEGFRYHFNDYR